MTTEGIKKISRTLEESLEKLGLIAKMPKGAFLKSKSDQDIAKWNFYVAVQSCLDLGNHIISVKGLEAPERYEEIITILYRNEIISKGLANSIEGMGGFRNLLAHGYFKIDLDKLYGYLKKLNDIRKFVRKLEPYLGK